MTDTDMAEVLLFLQALIRLDSCNPPGYEEPVARAIAQQARQLGLETTVIPLAKGRANVISVLHGSGHLPGLLYVGHLDTVPPGNEPWQHQPHSAEVVGGRLCGRGAVDMKSGMAAMVMAAGMLAREKVQMRGDLIVAGLAGEEVDSLGAKSFAASGGLGGIGAIVVGEPTNLEVATAHKGALWLEITTLGKMAHGAMPELGVNAIVQMQLLLRKLLDYQPSYRPHSFLGPPTMNVGTIHGGVKTNMVPDRCVATIDLRTLPGQSHKQVVQEIGDISAGLGREVPGFRAKIGVIIDRPSVDTPVDEPLVQAALHVAKKVLGRDSGPRGKGYFTDASILTPASGAPTIIFGPGSDQLAHKVDEYVEIDQVFAAMEFFAHLARKVLS